MGSRLARFACRLAGHRWRKAETLARLPRGETFATVCSRCGEREFYTHIEFPAVVLAAAPTTAEARDGD